MGKVLTADQVDMFWRDGWLCLERAVSESQLTRLRADMNEWVKQSRNHSQNYGETINGRPRFDLGQNHSEHCPGLRRVNAPVEVSQAHLEVATESAMVDAVADLVGPSVKFHHSKTNAKLPGSETVVHFHQDFAFTPHSNSDVVTALLFLDDVSKENGCLEVVPGSHRGETFSLWHDGVFTGAVSDQVAGNARARAVEVTGAAGSVCLMHTKLIHGSAANRSQQPRTLFICVYSAEDAVALSPNPMPSRYEGLMVRGARSGKVRSSEFEVELPELPSGTSFFEQQTRVS